MARKTKTLTIAGDADNRDAGKQFLITEMSADRAERWAVRALLALARAGVEVPDTAQASLAAFAAAGIKALGQLDPDTLQPLLDEMFACVQFIPERAGVPPQAIRDGVNSQIEEISTRFKLRQEVLQLHVGFLLAGAVQNSESQSDSARPA